jgi:hypothetical protein
MATNKDIEREIQRAENEDFSHLKSDNKEKIKLLKQLLPFAKKTKSIEKKAA